MHTLSGTTESKVFYTWKMKLFVFKNNLIHWKLKLADSLKNPSFLSWTRKYFFRRKQNDKLNRILKKNFFILVAFFQLLNGKTWLCQFVLCHQSILSCASNTCTTLSTYIYFIKAWHKFQIRKKAFLDRFTIWAGTLKEVEGLFVCFLVVFFN